MIFLSMSQLFSKCVFMRYFPWIKESLRWCWPALWCRLQHPHMFWTPSCRKSPVCLSAQRLMLSYWSKVASAIRLPTGGMFCVPLRVSSNFYLFWIPILSFETLLCALALFRGFQTFRSGGTLFLSGRLLVITLIRDSVLYFFVYVYCDCSLEVDINLFP